MQINPKKQKKLHSKITIILCLSIVVGMSTSCIRCITTFKQLGESNEGYFDEVSVGSTIFVKLNTKLIDSINTIDIYTTEIRYSLSWSEHPIYHFNVYDIDRLKGTDTLFIKITSPQLDPDCKRFILLRDEDCFWYPVLH